MDAFTLYDDKPGVSLSILLILLYPLWWMSPHAWRTLMVVESSWWILENKTKEYGGAFLRKRPMSASCLRVNFTWHREIAQWILFNCMLVPVLMQKPRFTWSKHLITLSEVRIIPIPVHISPKPWRCAAGVTKTFTLKIHLLLRRRKRTLMNMSWCHLTSQSPLKPPWQLR